MSGAVLPRSLDALASVTISLIEAGAFRRVKASDARGAAANCVALGNDWDYTRGAAVNQGADVSLLPELWEGPVGLYEVTDSGTGEPAILEIKEGQVRFTVPSVKVSNSYLIKRPHRRIEPSPSAGFQTGAVKEATDRRGIQLTDGKPRNPSILV